MAKLILIRHCASQSQVPESELTEAGALAAVALANQLMALNPDAIYASPYRRAIATVQPFADASGLAIRQDPRLKERVLTAEDRDDWFEHLRRSYDDHDHKLPTGESQNEAQARALAALTEIAAAGHRLPVVVSHGGLISTILRAADPSFGFEEWRALRNPDLFEVSHEAGRPVAFARIE